MTAFIVYWRHERGTSHRTSPPGSAKDHCLRLTFKGKLCAPYEPSLKKRQVFGSIGCHVNLETNDSSKTYNFMSQRYQ